MCHVARARIVSLSGSKMVPPMSHPTTPSSPTPPHPPTHAPPPISHAHSDRSSHTIQHYVIDMHTQHMHGVMPSHCICVMLCLLYMLSVMVCLQHNKSRISYTPRRRYHVSTTHQHAHQHQHRHQHQHAHRHQHQHHPSHQHLSCINRRMPCRMLDRHWHMEISMRMEWRMSSLVCACACACVCACAHALALFDLANLPGIDDEVHVHVCDGMCMFHACYQVHTVPPPLIVLRWAPSTSSPHHTPSHSHHQHQSMHTHGMGMLLHVSTITWMG